MTHVEIKHKLLRISDADELRQAEAEFRKDIKADARGLEYTLESYFFILLANINRSSAPSTRLFDDITAFNETLGLLVKRFDKYPVFFKRDRIKDLERKSFCDIWIHRLQVLERECRNKSFDISASEFFVTRMNLLRSRSYYVRNFTKYIGLFMLDIGSKYGTSFAYLAVNVLISTIIFASLMMFADVSVVTELQMIPESHFGDYVYLSIGTLTNLGADGTPITLFQQVNMITEAIYGVFLFGMFIALIAKKVV